MTSSVVQETKLRLAGLLMNDELGRMWNEAAMTYLNLLPQHSLGGTEKNNENISQNSPCRGPDFN
jgi:hypothetical protein